VSIESQKEIEEMLKEFIWHKMKWY
jgi:hypothetical protein